MNRHGRIFTYQPNKVHACRWCREPLENRALKYCLGVECLDAAVKDALRRRDYIAYATIRSTRYTRTCKRVLDRKLAKQATP